MGDSKSIMGLVDDDWLYDRTKQGKAIKRRQNLQADWQTARDLSGKQVKMWIKMSTGKSTSPTAFIVDSKL